MVLVAASQPASPPGGQSGLDDVFLRSLFVCGLVCFVDWVHLVCLRCENAWCTIGIYDSTRFVSRWGPG